MLGFTISPLLLIDFYKATHKEQYPKGLTRLVSYQTPRASRLEGKDYVINWGVQAYCYQILVREFQSGFFNRTLEDVIEEYKMLDYTLGEGSYDMQKIIDLHSLGYLPIMIRTLPEGTKVPMGVPCVEISNTHPDFIWLVNTIETGILAHSWHMMTVANMAYEYREIVNQYYEVSVDNNVPRARALGDFSYRGQYIEEGIRSSASWLLSFLNTATVPAIRYMCEYYGVDYKKDAIGFGAISTEHSCMCSNFAIDKSERIHFKRLLTEIYPNHSFSMVSDSYDYWYLVDVIIPSLKDEILAHGGTLAIRGDSGDPVYVVTETVFRLWKQFGGTINSKGFKVLNPKIKALYGDSITHRRLKEIYKILIDNGYACNNVSLGVGALSMEAYENPKTKMFEPYTRDTYGFAVKSTYAEKGDEKIFIFKDPKTDDTKTKKSQKGCCIVYTDENGNIKYEDEHTFDETYNDKNMMRIMFLNGTVYSETLHKIRARLWEGKF